MAAHGILADTRAMSEPFLSLFPMPRLHLTDIAVRRLKPLGQQVIYWDTVSPVALRLSQAGGKSFMVVVGDDRRKITLGKYPDMSLADARAEAERIVRGPSQPTDRLAVGRNGGGAGRLPQMVGPAIIAKARSTRSSG